MSAAPGTLRFAHWSVVEARHHVIMPLLERLRHDVSAQLSRHESCSKSSTESSHRPKSPHALTGPHSSVTLRPGSHGRRPALPHPCCRPCPHRLLRLCSCQTCLCCRGSRQGACALQNREPACFALLWWDAHKPNASLACKLCINAWDLLHLCPGNVSLSQAVRGIVMGIPSGSTWLCH